MGRKSNPDGVRAGITYQSGDFRRTLTKVGGGSYLSSHDPRVVLGFGSRQRTNWVEIHWPKPSVLVQHLTNLPIDRYITIVEGEQKWK